MFLRTVLALMSGLLSALPVVADQPVADAGGHQFDTRYVEVGQSVRLDGTRSYGRGCDLAYAWNLTVQPDGSDATIANPGSATPTFVPDVAGDYLIDLVVGDAQGTSDPARVSVSAFQCTECPLPMADNQCMVDPIPVPCQLPLPVKNAERWMQLTPGLMDRTLREITLPGTHDSGAYWLDKSRRGPDYNDKGFSTSWWQDVVLWIGGTDEYEIKNEVAYDVTLAHDRTLLQQLNAGIRYFDLRVTRRDGVFYTYHALLGRPLTTLLQDIRTFMAESEKELIVVDVSHLNVGTHETNDSRGFTADEHRLLMQLLVDELGPYLYPRNGGSTDELLATPLGQITADGPRILLVYAGVPAAAIDPNSEWFWPDGFWTSPGGFTNTTQIFDSEPVPCPRGDQTGKGGQFPDQLCSAVLYSVGGSVKGFVLHQTLTADEGVATNAGKCRAGQHLPWLPVEAGIAKLYLETFCDETRTLRQLSRTVNPYLPEMLGAISPVRPGLMRVDFYQESAVVSEAIRLNQVDLRPPRTTASSVPPPNEHDCNTTSVTARLLAWDEKGGSGVKEVHYWMSGTSEPNTVSTCGSQVDVPIAARGVTTLHYYGVDRAGNAETLKTLEVSIAPTGDMTGDCRIDRDDLEALMRAIRRGSVPETADADEDGNFTASDFKKILCASGAPCDP